MWLLSRYDYDNGYGFSKIEINSTLPTDASPAGISLFSSFLTNHLWTRVHLTRTY